MTTSHPIPHHTSNPTSQSQPSQPKSHQHTTIRTPTKKYLNNSALIAELSGNQLPSTLSTNHLSPLKTYTGPSPSPSTSTNHVPPDLNDEWAEIIEGCIHIPPEMDWFSRFEHKSPRKLTPHKTRSGLGSSTSILSKKVEVSLYVLWLWLEPS